MDDKSNMGSGLAKLFQHFESRGLFWNDHWLAQESANFDVLRSVKNSLACSIPRLGMRFGLCSARRLGISSPITRDKYVMTRTAMVAI
jgi:hypothetical protein